MVDVAAVVAQRRYLDGQVGPLRRRNVRERNGRLQRCLAAGECATGESLDPVDSAAAAAVAVVVVVVVVVVASAFARRGARWKSSSAGDANH